MKTGTQGRRPYVRPEMARIDISHQLLAASAAAVTVEIFPLDYYYDNICNVNGRMVRGYIYMADYDCDATALLAALESMAVDVYNDPLLGPGFCHDVSDEWISKTSAEIDELIASRLEYDIKWWMLTRKIRFDGADWDAAHFFANAQFDGCSGGTYNGQRFTWKLQ